MSQVKTPKIYKLVDHVHGNIYVGSTMDTIQKRKYSHGSKYRHYLKKGGVKGFVSAFEVIKHGNWDIELLEELDPNATPEEMRQRERHFMEQFENVVNKNVPSRTPEQYYQDNCETLLRKCRDKYHLIKDKKREYYLANREKRLAYAKNRYPTIRETVLAKETCACGVTYCKQVMTKHKKTCEAHLATLGGEPVVL